MRIRRTKKVKHWQDAGVALSLFLMEWKAKFHLTDEEEIELLQEEVDGMAFNHKYLQRMAKK